jgi:hypothetical protein
VQLAGRVLQPDMVQVSGLRIAMPCVALLPRKIPAEADQSLEALILPSWMKTGRKRFMRTSIEAICAARVYESIAERWRAGKGPEDSSADRACW